MGYGFSQRNLSTAFIFIQLSIQLCTFKMAQASSAEAHSKFSIERVFHSNSQLNQNYQYAQQALKKLGFIDYTSQIAGLLKSSTKISDVSRLALEKNRVMLASINASRDLAAFMFAALSKNQSSEAETNAIEQLIIQQLRPFPMLNFEPASVDLENKMKNLPLTEALELKRSWVKQRALQRFSLEKNNLRQLFLILSRDWPNFKNDQSLISQWLDLQITNSISDAYTVQTRQQNRLLGHALVLSYVSYIRHNRIARLEDQLKQKMRAQGMYLESYTLAYYVHLVADNDPRAFALKNGDIALEYYHGQESFFTSLVIEPSAKENKAVADQYNLHTKLHNAFRFLDTSQFYSVLDKIEASQPTAESERKVYKEFWNHDYARGFSHSGLVRVHKDEETGLKMAWVWDAYPERDKVGPMRLMTVQGFAYPERMMRIGFLRYSPHKVLESFKKQIQKRGYLKTVWQSNGSFVGKTNSGEIVPSQDDEVRYNWPTHVDEVKIQEWIKTPSSQADSWFENELMPRVFARLDDYLAGSNAILYADGFSNGKDLLYCSQMIVIAFLQGGNFDIQETPDQVWKLITYFSDQVQAALKLSIDQRLVSPNGLIWQKNIFENLFQAQLTNSTTRAQMRQRNPTWAQTYTLQLNQPLEELKNSLKIPWKDTTPEIENKIKVDAVAFDVET